MFPFGVNDTTAGPGGTRTEPEMSCANLDAILIGEPLMARN